MLKRFLKEFEAAGGVLLNPKGSSLEESLETLVRKESIANYALSSRTPKFKRVHSTLKALGVPKAVDYEGLDLGITGAYGAGAKTGTLVTAFEKGRAHLLTSLSRIYLVILRENLIFPTVGEAVLTLLTEKSYPYISLITGPSKTGDIELFHVNGVHGPEKLFLVVV